MTTSAARPTAIVQHHHGRINPVYDFEAQRILREEFSGLGEMCDGLFYFTFKKSDGDQFGRAIEQISQRIDLEFEYGPMETFDQAWERTKRENPGYDYDAPVPPLR